MAKPKLRKFDAANYLKSAKDIALYLEACLKEGGDDPAFIAAALVTSRAPAASVSSPRRPA